MKPIFLLLLFTLLVTPVIGQVVCEGDVILTTQAEVDAFTCTEVKGTVLISGPDITNLNALSALEKVGEHFIINEAHNLLNLDGLENLTHVTCSFEIKNNENIREISAVSNLTRVGRNLTFSGNSSLTSLAGISQIDSVLNINVFDNPSLYFCCELAPIIENGGVYGYANIYNNAGFCRLETVETCDSDEIICDGDLIVSSQEEINNLNCTIILGDLTLRVESEAFDLSPLQRLKEISGTLNLEFALQQSLTGLSGLEKVGEDIYLENTNYQSFLEIDLSPLESLTSVNSLTITEGIFTGTLPSYSDTIPELIMGPGGIISPEVLSNSPGTKHIFISLGYDERYKDVIPLLLDGGDLIVDSGNFSLAGLRGITSLGELRLTGLTMPSFFGFEDLIFVDKLNFLGVNVKGDYCGISNLLRNGTINELSWLFSVEQEQILNNCNYTTACTPEIDTEIGKICQGDIVLDSQQDIDMFDCEVINGDLTIRGSGISSLEGLSSLQEIGGSLVIENLPQLTSLTGLENLVKINCSLTVSGNSELTSLDELSSLEVLGSNLVIEENNNLISINALANVNQIRNLFIFNNPELTECCGIRDLIINATEGVLIGNNKPDCSQTEILSCIYSEPVCESHVTIRNQSDADNFNCSIVLGNVTLLAEQPIALDSLYILKEVLGSVYLNYWEAENYTGFYGLRNLQSTETLRIHSLNSPPTVDLSEFENLSKLEYLDVIYTNLENAFPNLSQLDGLYITASDVDDATWLDPIDSLSSLDLLNFYDSQKTEEFLAKIGEGGSVRIIDSDFEHLTGLTGIKHLERFESLNSTGISFDGLDGLVSADEFIVEGTTVENCCGLSGFLSSTPAGEYSFQNNSCSLTDVFNDCLGFCPGSYTLTTQAEVNAFTCQRIEGNLTLSGTNIYNLDSLYRLETVGQDFIINGTRVYKLSGLNSVDSIGRDLRILNNSSLSNTQGLLNLRDVNRNLSISNNNNLQTVRGLENVRSPYNLTIDLNPRLNNCCILEAVTDRVLNNVTIQNNGAECSGPLNCNYREGVCPGDIYLNTQTEVDAFNCVVVTGFLDIQSNENLETSSLNVLDSIYGNLTLGLNGSDVNGLNSLKHIGQELKFNPRAYYQDPYSLDAFSSLQYVRKIRMDYYTSYTGQLLTITDTIDNVQVEYVQGMANKDWLPNVSVIDTLTVSGISEDQVDYKDLMRRLPDNGVFYAYFITIDDLLVFQGRTALGEINLFTMDLNSFDGIEELRQITNLRVRDVRSNDCCGLYNLLNDGTISGELIFENESCTIDEILEGCAPEEITTMSVYPNPAVSSNVTLEWTGNQASSSRIQVLDNFGKIVYDETVPAGEGKRDALVDISKLSRGTFLVRIITGDDVELRRLVRK